MASTWSPLKIELIATGEQSGTWGVTTNTNLGTALEEAITGSADVTFASGPVTLTLTDTNASQIARNLRLNLTGTSGGAQNLIVPAIEKLYLVNNGCADTITVKNSTGTGVAVPAGKQVFVYNNGTNVLDATTYLSSVTLGTALPVTSGGTGASSASITAFNNITGYTASGATGTTSTNLVFSTSPSLTTPTLGVASATSINKVAFTAPATGSTLTIADGKTLTANNSLTLAGTDSTTMTFPSASATLAGLAVAQTFTAKQTLTGSTTAIASKIVNALEGVTISATAATGTINYDVTTQDVLYYTTSASANWTVNFRGNGSNSLDSLMATGEAITVVFLVTQGATAYYNNAVQVDGNAVTPKYQGGTAWAAGNASSIDSYSYTIVKTGSATFTVFASQTQFK